MHSVYKNIDDLPLALTVPQLMKALNIGRTKAYELVRSNEIKCLWVGRSIRIPKAEVERYLGIYRT